MDVKKQNSFLALPKRPLIFFLLEFFFYILVVVVLSICNAVYTVQPSSQWIQHQTMAKVLFQGAVGSVTWGGEKKELFQRHGRNSI